MTKIDQLPYVEAELNYIVPMAERPRYYAYEPGPGDPADASMRAGHLFGRPLAFRALPARTPGVAPSRLYSLRAAGSG